MNLTHYVRILVRRGWIIVLAVLITAGAAFGLSKLQTPTYRATQKVLLEPARFDLGLTETLTRMLRSFVVFLDTDEQANNAIERLQLDMTAGELRSHTTISSDPNNLTVQIDVDMEDGPLAAQIATELGRLLVEARTEDNRDLTRENRIDAILMDTASDGLHCP